MKLHQAYAGALVASALTVSLAGCDADMPGSDTPAVATIVAVNTAPDCGDTGSRTAVDPTEYTSGQIGVNWLPGDKIGVYGDKGSGNVGFDNQSQTETDKTTFTGKLKDGEKPLYAYYPYNPAVGDDPTALSGTLPLTQHYSTATRELEGDWKVGAPAGESSAEFRFRHILAFFKFDINAGGTDVAGETLKSVSLKIAGAQLGGDFKYDIPGDKLAFTPTEGSDKVTMEWSDTPALRAATFHGYMSVAPCSGLQGKNIDIVITTNKHIIKFSQTCKVDEIEASAYYTVPLELSRFASDWTIEDNPDAAEENAAWVPGLESRLCCANTVFAVPGQSFMHKIRVPQSTSQTGHGVVPVKTGVKRAYNLPEGLTWNAERCLVEGTAPAVGEYTYSVEFELDGATYKEGIHLTVSDNLISPTPMMGWQSWNVLKDNISETIIENQAQKMVELGLRDAGYVYVGIDDCWQVKDKNDNGHQIADPNKFPNGMKAIADKIHSYGMKAGIYTDCGTKTCEKYFASYGYEELHAQDYYAWGFDFVKEDWYYSVDMAPTGATESTFVDGYAGLNTEWNSRSKSLELYTKMGQALAANNILLYMCEWGVHDPWKWGAETGATCWRMSYDARDGWWGCTGTGSGTKNNDENKNGVGLHNTIVLMRNLWPYVGVNRYNDADMLCIGIRGTGQSSNDCVYGVSKSGSTYYTGSFFNKKTYTGMSDTEYETNFAMWCMWSSPLLLSIDMTRTDLNAHDLSIMKNEELIAVNQDPMGQGAEYVRSVGDLDYYSKDLANGDVAIAVVNLGDNSGNYSIALGDYEALDANATYSVRNLLSKSDAGTLSASAALTGSLAAHGTFIIRLKKQ